MNQKRATEIVLILFGLLASPLLTFGQIDDFSITDAATGQCLTVFVAQRLYCWRTPSGVHGGSISLVARNAGKDDGAGLQFRQSEGPAEFMEGELPLDGRSAWAFIRVAGKDGRAKTYDLQLRRQGAPAPDLTAAAPEADLLEWQKSNADREAEVRKLLGSAEFFVLADDRGGHCLVLRPGAWLPGTTARSKQSRAASYCWTTPAGKSVRGVATLDAGPPGAEQGNTIVFRHVDAGKTVLTGSLSVDTGLGAARLVRAAGAKAPPWEIEDSDYDDSVCDCAKDGPAAPKVSQKAPPKETPPQKAPRQVTFDIVRRRIVPRVAFRPRLEIVGARLSYGGAYPMPITVLLAVDRVVTAPWGAFDRALGGNVNAGKMTAYKSAGAPAKAAVVFKARSWRRSDPWRDGRQEQHWEPHLTVSATELADHCLMLRRDDPIPDLASFRDAGALAGFLQPYVKDNKIALAADQVLCLFELGVPEAAGVAADFQDLAILVTLIPPGDD